MKKENPIQDDIQETIPQEPICESCDLLKKRVIKYKSAALKYYNELKNIQNNKEEIHQMNEQNEDISDELLIIRAQNKNLVEQNQKYSIELQEFQSQLTTIQDLRSRIQYQDQLLNQVQKENESNLQQVDEFKKKQQDSSISQQFEICIQQLNKNVSVLEVQLDKKKAKIQQMKLQQKMQQNNQQIQLINATASHELHSLNELMKILDQECKYFFNISITKDIFQILYKQVTELQGFIGNLQNIINNQNYQFSQLFGLNYSPESLAQIKNEFDQNNEYHNARYVKLKEQLNSKKNVLEQQIQDLEERDFKSQAQIKNLNSKNQFNLSLIQKLKESQDVDQSFNSIFLNESQSPLYVEKNLQSRNLNFEEHNSFNLARSQRGQAISNQDKIQKENNTNYLQKQKVLNQNQSTQTFVLQFQQLLSQEIKRNMLLYQNQVQQKCLINDFNIHEILTHVKTGTYYQDRNEIYQLCTLTYDPQNYMNYTLLELQSCQIKVSPYLLKLHNKQKQTDKVELNCQLIQLRVKDDSQFKEKIFMVRQKLASPQPYKNLQQGFSQASNNKLLDIILKKFQEDLELYDIQCSIYKIPQSFILKNRDTENYYYIEELVTSQQGIQLLPGNSDQWIQNTFLSLYSYNLSQGRAMITNIDTVDSYYYDTYISTSQGQLSPFDQGEEGIQKRLQYVNQHREKFAKYKKILEQF